MGRQKESYKSPHYLWIIEFIHIGFQVKYNHAWNQSNLLSFLTDENEWKSEDRMWLYIGQEMSVTERSSGAFLNTINHQFYDQKQWLMVHEGDEGGWDWESMQQCMENKSTLWIIEMMKGN